MQPRIFLTREVIHGTFPLILKVALRKQDIYLLLSVGITRHLSPKWLIEYFAGKTCIFLKA